MLRQPRKGYRAGMDAALLAAACQIPQGRQAVELGCGVAAALLAAAWRNPDGRFIGLERDRDAARLAQHNVAANGLSDRVQIFEADIGEGKRALRHRLPQLGGDDGNGVDLVMANPPYFDDPDRLRAPADEKRGAWIADHGLAAWIDLMLSLLRENGTFLMIHRADRLADILGGLAGRAGSVRIRPVQAFADEPASRVLVRATKTGKAPLVLLPPLVLHAKGQTGHRPDVETLLKGETALGWD